jgi:hypothetical protein
MAIDQEMPFAPLETFVAVVPADASGLLARSEEIYRWRRAWSQERRKLRARMAKTT